MLTPHRPTPHGFLPSRHLHRAAGFTWFLVVVLCGGRLPAADNPVFVARVAAQIAALRAEKAARSPAQRKLNSALIYADRAARLGRASAALPSFQPSVLADRDGTMLVDLSATVSVNLLDAITLVGGTVLGSYPRDHSVRARIPVTALESLATRTDVRSIEPAVGFRTNVTSEGDVAHLANSARTISGMDGTGVKVGVLSDSVDHLATSQSLGELGTVTVLAGQAGSGLGEGTAMLEIVHDLAPGAPLYFASAFGGPAAFAQNIRDLKAAGCQVIVDDVTYFNESPFQDGIIARAVNEVSLGDVLYFSSAGNSGNKNDGTSGTWEGDFVDSGVALGDGSRLHDFGGGVTQNVVTIASSGRVDLFWADPLGASDNDYDLYVANSSGTLVRGSTGSQTGTQDPYESISTLSAGERVIIARYSGAARFLHVDTGRSRLAISTSGQTRGHNAANAPNAFCVAATSAAGRTSAFTGGGANPVETFSSDGFRRVFFSPEGAALTPGDFSSTGGLLLAKPDVTAADGVVTSLAAPFNPFYGTSAAAPHAAAIAALLRAVRPTLTGTQLRAALAASALDIEGAGLDRDSGPGIIMAPAALAALPSTPNLTPFTPAGWSARIVVSSTTGTNTDDAQFLISTPYFVDIAVANNGGSSIPAGFTTEIYLDEVLASTFTTGPGLAANGISTAIDFSVSTLSAGQHTIRVKTDAGSTVAEADETDNEFSRTITVIDPATLPNLAPYTPSGWSDHIVVSTVTGTNLDGAPLYSTDPLYIDFAVACFTAGSGSSFGLDLTLDGNVIASFTSPALSANTFASAMDVFLGALGVGEHTIGISIDPEQIVAENNEADNIYTRTFTVLDSPPVVTLPGAPVTYLENAAPLILDPAAIVTDADSANFNDGSLTVDFTSTSLAEDRLVISAEGDGAGQIDVSGNVVNFGGAAIGTFTGGTSGVSPLVVSFGSGAATPAAVQALVRRITYLDVSDAPSPATRVVRFVVNDGDGAASAPATKTVSVTPVNDPPTLDLISNPAPILEDSGTQFVVLTGISAGGGETQTLTITATSNNPSLIPHPGISYTSPTASASLSYTPLPNASGSAVITVVLDDGQAMDHSITRTFTIQVTAATSIQAWRYGYFGTTANSGAAADLADADLDGQNNLIEFAFGTDPTNPASGSPALSYTGTFGGGGTISAAGQPVAVFEGSDFRALFVRRTDFVAAGLTYVPEFSTDGFSTWAPGTDPPTVLASGGSLQIVSVPFPPSNSEPGGRYFRIRIILVP